MEWRSYVVVAFPDSHFALADGSAFASIPTGRVVGYLMPPSEDRSDWQDCVCECDLFFLLIPDLD